MLLVNIQPHPRGVCSMRLKETFESDDELAKQAKLKEVTDLLNKILK